MILVVETTTSDELFEMGLHGHSDFDFDVRYGDETEIEIYRGSHTKFGHIYSSPGTYNVTIYARRMERWNGCLTQNLVDVLQWGTYDWGDAGLMFDNCHRLSTISAVDAPHLMHARSMEYMFANCITLNADLDHWDVSKVKWMGGVFFNAISFNGQIGSWDTSSSIYTARMFRGARSFDQDISGWDVSSVYDMQGMFNGAVSFNKPVGGWDVRKVEKMVGMFANTLSFNQPVGTWDVSSVQDMNSMFSSAESFDQTLSSWAGKMDKVKDVEWMFFKAKVFNQDLSSWTLPLVDSYFRFAQNAYRMEGPVMEMKGDLKLAMAGTRINQPVSHWDATKITNLIYTFSSSFDQDISSWSVSHLPKTKDVLEDAFGPAMVITNLPPEWREEPVVSFIRR